MSLEEQIALAAKVGTTYVALSGFEVVYSGDDKDEALRLAAADPTGLTLIFEPLAPPTPKRIHSRGRGR